MIEHLFEHPAGLAHVLVALAALVFGAAVVALRKGDRRHRWLGRAYLLSMLGLNATALSVYELFGGFGPFHGLALFSLATVLSGYAAARRRKPGWKIRHAYFMAGSYVGLVAAAVAEVASRVPGWSFNAAVITASALAVFGGLGWMMRWVPRSL